MVSNLKGLSESAEKLLPVLDGLSDADREGLARYLLRSIPEPTEDDPEIRALWKAELRRRVDEIKSGKVTGIPAEEVDRRMQEKYP